MDIKEILKKIAEGKTLTDEEKEFIGKFDPESTDRIPKSRLDAEIAKKKEAEKVENLEANGLSEADKAKKDSEKQLAKLQKQVDDLTKERDEARRQITARDFTAEVGKLASAHKFDNPEYLEYLITKKQLDLKDEAAVSQFFKELETSVPSHFQSDAHPGSGSGPGKETSSNAAAGQQRIKELLGKKELSMIEVSELIRLQNGQSQPPADSNQPKPE
ncbi:MAG: hypothetical protein E7055_01755 [Lentisphaerae bacterium]|nr:hypothetical protein [Lentisphaerota bacterium]